MIKLQGILTPFLSLFVLAIPQHSQAAKIIVPPSTVAQADVPPQPTAQSAEKLCQSGDLSFLEGGLIPKAAEKSEALPPKVPLEVPQQAPAVALQKTLPLTLPATIRLAFERNPDLQTARLQFQRSCAQLKQAKAALFPSLAVSGSIARTDGSSFSPANRSYSGADAQFVTAALQQQLSAAQQQLQLDITTLQERFQETSTQVQTTTLDQQIRQLQQRASQTATLSTPVDFTPLDADAVALPLSSGSGGGGTGGYFNGALTLNYNIFTGGQRDASIQSSRRQVESAVLEVQRQLQALRQTITSNYYDLQQTQALIAVSEGSVKSLQENLRIVQLGTQAGTRTQFEVLQASVSLADSLQNRTQARSLYTIARRQLVQQLDLPDTVDVTLPSATTPERAGLWGLSLEESIVLALNNRVELNQTLLQRQIVLLQKRIVASQRQPRVQGFASLNLADDLEDRFLGAYGYSVGVQMNLNIFDGGDVRSQLRQLDKNIESIDQQFNQLKESIRLEVEQAFYDLQANSTNIDTANGALVQANESLRLAEVRRDAGVGTTLEVVRAQADLTQAQSNSIQAVLDYNRALVRLERATGFVNIVENP
ncbi:TolC family protein [Altericista sp. CCNU0014]|uniref:TolC family protein n=1 Tax=Altericista sp. CCNU0014 TaxID=3082949 RepID=UPI00384D5305